MFTLRSFRDRPLRLLPRGGAARLLALAIAIALAFSWGGSWASAAAPPAGAAASTPVCRVAGRSSASLTAEDATGDALARLFAYLRLDAEVGAPLLDSAARLGFTVCLGETDSGAYSVLDPVHRRVHVDAELEPGTQALFLVHELRHLDALLRGFSPSVAMPLGDALRLQLAGEADAQAVATLFASHVREAGSSGAWDALLGTELYRDIATAFERELARSGDELRATQSAFEQWYVEDRRVSAYHMLALQHHLHALRVHGEPATLRPIPEGCFDDFCALPGGRIYGPGPGERSR